MNPSKFLRTNNLIFTAMLVGMTGFTIVSYFVTATEKFFAVPDFSDTFFIPVFVFFVGALFTGNLLFQKQIQKVTDENIRLRQKIAVYFSSSIIRYALIEGPVLFAIVAFITSGNMFYLIFVGLGLVYFISLKPRQEKIAKDINLTYEQQSELGMK